ncbi:MAG: chromate transporter [Bacilli bacterium]|nr:chromate transporter [Bacilli bacterium]MBN2876115.1 chromate transporter [Bacilli bacterium]
MLLLLKLFGIFFKIGLFTFGGGYAMIPLITDEVMKYGWVDSLDALIDFFAISQSTPGAFAINIATFVGFEQEGIIGAVFATFGVVLPSFVIILLIAVAFKHFRDNKYVNGFLGGIRPVVPGIILSVAIVFISRSIFGIENRQYSDFTFELGAIIIFAISFAVSKLKKRIHPVIIVLISGLMGLLFYGLGWF